MILITNKHYYSPGNKFQNTHEKNYIMNFNMNSRKEVHWLGFAFFLSLVKTTLASSYSGLVNRRTFFNQSESLGRF